MPTLFLTIGLPASGKSTWAHEMAQQSHVTEVSKDDLRLHPDAPKNFRQREQWVFSTEQAIVQSALNAGQSIVVHDTNLNPVHPDRFHQLAEQAGADFVVVDFTEVPVEECIRRDAQRANSVGEHVIRTMHSKYREIFN